ncbi:MAG: hypothetical protein WBB01_19645 [Phormidesmis sp.]
MKSTTTTDTLNVSPNGQGVTTGRTQKMFVLGEYTYIILPMIWAGK